MSIPVESLPYFVTELADEIYLSLATIGTALTSLWDGLTEKLRSAPQSTDLAPLLETIVCEFERRGKLFNGAGVVMADSVLADRPRHLEWWLPDVQRGPQRLMLESNPHSEYFYDCTEMDWFAIPREPPASIAHIPAAPTRSRHPEKPSRPQVAFAHGKVVSASRAFRCVSSGRSTDP
ncbi:hypothetical protein OHB12_08395 [Nocardia sp. NBC_01730]|uniref:hypothetical protein n=1 Tax=Nocardia sp. NBC_01730 TaxID=2975998 RepID=UPI002E11D15A|nr:hypothetical protein OHB12_08395 [Nocardia sp. NBC_01730]